MCHGHENYKDERISKGHEQTMANKDKFNSKSKNGTQKCKKFNKLCKTSIQAKLYYEYMTKH
jgi:hypothetical protein